MLTVVCAIPYTYVEYRIPDSICNRVKCESILSLPKPLRILIDTHTMRDKTYIYIGTHYRYYIIILIVTPAVKQYLFFYFLLKIRNCNDIN